MPAGVPVPAVSGLWSHSGSPLQAPSHCQARSGPASTLQRRTEFRPTRSVRVPQALLHEGPFHGEGPTPWVPRPGRGLLTSMPGAHTARARGPPSAPCAHGLARRRSSPSPLEVSPLFSSQLGVKPPGEPSHPGAGPWDTAPRGAGARPAALGRSLASKTCSLPAARQLPGAKCSRGPFKAGGS